MFCLTGYGSADCGKKFNNCSNFASSRSWHSRSSQYTECSYADVLLLFTKGDVSNFCTSTHTWTYLMQWICFNILSPGRIMYKVALVSEYFLCNIFMQLFEVQGIQVSFCQVCGSHICISSRVFRDVMLNNCNVFVVLFCIAKQGTSCEGGWCWQTLLVMLLQENWYSLVWH